jgi:hypothetical protein
MIKLTTKEDVALLVEEASEMFEETGCVPDLDGKKVRAQALMVCSFWPAAAANSRMASSLGSAASSHANARRIS